MANDYLGPDSLDELKQQLYRREGWRSNIRRSPLQTKYRDLRTSWPIGETTTNHPRAGLSLLTKLTWLAVAFFVISVAIGVVVVWRQKDLISAGNIDLVMSGPATISAGTTVPLQLLITNKNTINLETAALTVEYPDGTRSADAELKPLKRVRQELGVVHPGEAINKTLPAILFGEKDQTQVITATLEYRIAGSNAIYDKKITYHVMINASPLALNLNSPDEVVAGNELTFKVKITANAAVPLTNIILTVVYPAGFTFAHSSVTPLDGKSVWRLGDLPAGDERLIVITGRVDGQNDEAKTFRFNVGVADVANNETIGTIYTTVAKAVTITRPFVELTLRTNDDPAPEVVAKNQQVVRATVDWVNNLPTNVTAGRLEVKLAGEPLDRLTVTTNKGFFRSADNTIIWDKNTEPALASIAAGGSGSVSFNFSNLPLTRLASGAPPTIHLTAHFTGLQIVEGTAAEPVDTTVEKVIRLESVVALNQATTYHTGPFTNTGPVPPRVDTRTTYTLTWTVTNSSNKLRRAALKTILPNYTEWLGQAIPGGEQVVFNKDTGELVWDLGDVVAGPTGNRTLSVQLGLVPSTSQLNTIPPLAGPAIFEAVDTFTGTTISVSTAPATIDLPTDPGYHFGDGKVSP